MTRARSSPIASIGVPYSPASDFFLVLSTCHRRRHIKLRPTDVHMARLLLSVTYIVLAACGRGKRCSAWLLRRRRSSHAAVSLLWLPFIRLSSHEKRDLGPRFSHSVLGALRKLLFNHKHTTLFETRRSNTARHYALSAKDSRTCEHTVYGVFSFSAYLVRYERTDSFATTPK